MTRSPYTDTALDHAILIWLLPDKSLDEATLAVNIGDRSGGAIRVTERCLDLQQRGLIFSVDSQLWKLTVRGKQLVGNGKEV